MVDGKDAFSGKRSANSEWVQTSTSADTPRRQIALYALPLSRSETGVPSGRPPSGRNRCLDRILAAPLSRIGRSVQGGTVPGAGAQAPPLRDPPPTARRSSEELLPACLYSSLPQLHQLGADAAHPIPSSLRAISPLTHRVHQERLLGRIVGDPLVECASPGVA